MGRKIGGLVSLTLGTGLVDWVDEQALAEGSSRAATVRGILVDAYAAQKGLDRDAAIRAILRRGEMLTQFAPGAESSPGAAR